MPAFSLKGRKVLGAIDEIAHSGEEFTWSALIEKLEMNGLKRNTAKRYASEALGTRSSPKRELIQQGYVTWIRRGMYRRNPPTATEAWLRHQKALDSVPAKLLREEYAPEPLAGPRHLLNERGKPIAAFFIAWRKPAPPYPRRPGTYEAVRAMVSTKACDSEYRRTNKCLPDETIARASILQKQLRWFVKREPTFGRHFLRALLEEMERTTPVVVSAYPIRSRPSMRGFALRPKWQDPRQWTIKQNRAIECAWRAVRPALRRRENLRRVAEDPRVKPYLAPVSGWSYQNVPELP